MKIGNNKDTRNNKLCIKDQRIKRLGNVEKKREATNKANETMDTRKVETKEEAKKKCWIEGIKQDIERM